MVALNHHLITRKKVGCRHRQSVFERMPARFRRKASGDEPDGVRPPLALNRLDVLEFLAVVRADPPRGKADRKEGGQARARP